MATCPQIEIKVLSANAAKKLQAKFTVEGQLKYNSFALTTGMFGKYGKDLRGAFEGLFDTVQSTSTLAGNALIESLKGVDGDSNDRLDILQKTRPLLTNYDSSRNVLQILNRKGDKKVDELIGNSIAIRELISSINSEEHVQRNSYISKEELDVLNVGGVPVAIARLAYTIGHKLALARGIRKKGGTLHNHAFYTEIGNQELKKLADEGFITIDESATAEWLAGTAVTPDGKSIKGGLVKGPVARINEQTFTNFTANGNVNSSTSKELFTVLEQLNRLIMPYSQDPVKAEASTEVDKASGMAMDEETKETLQNIQEGKIVIAPAIKTLLAELRAMYVMDGGETAFETAINNKYKGKGGTDMVLNLFGITISGDTIYKDSEVGKKVARVAPLINLMQHYDRVANDAVFFLTYKQAHNARFFQKEDMLNMQSDKKMARPLLESGTVVEYNGKDSIDRLVNRITVNYGIPTDIVKGTKDGTTVKGGLEQMLRWMDDANYDEQIAIMMLASGENKTGIIAKTPWEVHKALRAIHDVRKGVNGHSVKTRVLLESDATASGPVLKMLQNMFQDNVLITLKRMKLIPSIAADGKLEPLDDFYMLAEEYYRDNIENSDLPANEEKTKAINSIMKLTGKEGDFRSFIKDVIIRFTYEQSPKANVRETAELLADDIMMKGVATMAEAVELLSIKDSALPKEFKSTNIKETLAEGAPALTIPQQYAIKDSLMLALKDGVAHYLVNDVLTPTYSTGMFDKGKETIDAIFKITSEQVGNLSKDDGITYKYMNPSIILKWVDDNPGKTQEDFPYEKFTSYRLIGDKLKETVIPVGDGSNMVLSMYHANSNSAHILPIHSLDSAILIRAIRAVYKDYKSTPEFAEKLIADISIMPIHDGVYLPPALAPILEAAYEQEIINSSMNYDVTYMMLMEAAYKQSVKIHERAKEAASDPSKVPFKMITLKELGEQISDLAPLIEEATANVRGKRKLLNVNPQGEKKGKGDTFKTISYSFATDVSKEAIDKVNAAYEERVKDINKPVKGDKVKEANVKEKIEPREVDKNSYKEIPYEDGVPTKDEVDTLVAAIDSDIINNNLVVVDTEATGNNSSDSSTVAHQLAFKTGMASKHIDVINLPVDEDLKLADGFMDFYDETHSVKHDTTDSSKRRSTIIAHINAKADTPAKIAAVISKFIEAMSAKDASVVFHNAPFDVGVLNKLVDNAGGNLLNMADYNVIDTLKVARYVRRADTLAASKKQGKAPDRVGGIVNMEGLTKAGNITNKAAHTAAGDVDALGQVITKLVMAYKENPNGYRTEGMPGEIVYNFATGKMDVVYTPAGLSNETKSSLILSNMKDKSPAAYKKFMETLEYDKEKQTNIAQTVMDVYINNLESCKG